MEKARNGNLPWRNSTTGIANFTEALSLPGLISSQLADKIVVFFYDGKRSFSGYGTGTLGCGIYVPATVRLSATT
jgi:hypothetical protein